MPHKPKKQSTGSYATHRDQHEGRQKQGKEKKKDNPNWRPKNETNKAREQRTKKQSEPSFLSALFGFNKKRPR